VAYALKKHVSKDIDNYWIDLADKIRKDLYAKTFEEKNFKAELKIEPVKRLDTLATF